jgi:hypothetical protein
MMIFAFVSSRSFLDVKDLLMHSTESYVNKPTNDKFLEVMSNVNTVWLNSTAALFLPVHA